MTLSYCTDEMHAEMTGATLDLHLCRFLTVFIFIFRFISFTDDEVVGLFNKYPLECAMLL
ncbi:hypothetical protein DPEC_G00112460 [Dallia pectoralis]|uniref:Uncharacterized protein n=1 Tax=Dallia pectoralis TaxID=75939 RepID=A0ACC2GT76_DALPE|nr:hypothetical protein DPEC_G00112460 [Dallia pectoralis]